MSAPGDRTLGEVVTSAPGSARVLESFGLDYCCGGGRSLTAACSAAGLDPDEVIGALERVAVEPMPDWASMGPGELLSQLRGHAGGFVLPADACASYRTLYEGLVELEADTHLHVHKENNVLFPTMGSISG
jgi:iron-sulfur cluster repair protein YtfE (RIC family)